MSHEQIDLKMTWGDAANIIAVVLMEGNPTGREQAIGELKRMAWIADNAFKPLEILHFDNEVTVVIEGELPIEEHDDLSPEEVVQKLEEMHEKYPQANYVDLR